MVTMTFDENVLMQRTLWMHLVKHRADYRCEDCGDPLGSSDLHAHHVNHHADDHRLANGRCLCKPCHDKRHAAERSERMKLVRPKLASFNKGRRMSEAQKKKMREVAAHRDPDYYNRAVAAKRAKGLDFTAIADKGWETKRKRRAETL